jgi:hypothetical protein
MTCLRDLFDLKAGVEISQLTGSLERDDRVIASNDEKHWDANTGDELPILRRGWRQDLKGLDCGLQPCFGQELDQVRCAMGVPHAQLRPSGSTAKASSAQPAAQPFDIRSYTETPRTATDAARQLNALTQQLDVTTPAVRPSCRV